MLFAMPRHKYKKSAQLELTFSLVEYRLYNNMEGGVGGQVTLIISEFSDHLG